MRYTRHHWLLAIVYRLLNELQASSLLSRCSGASLVSMRRFFLPIGVACSALFLPGAGQASVPYLEAAPAWYRELFGATSCRRNRSLLVRFLRTRHRTRSAKGRPEEEVVIGDWCGGAGRRRRMICVE